MDVEPIPNAATAETLAAWARVGPDAVKAAEDVIATAYDVRCALAGVYTQSHVGVWLHPATKLAMLEMPANGMWSAQDHELVKAAVARILPDVVTPPADVPFDSVPCDWVKVAYSPSIRRFGELLNFFPGKYPGGVPNSPGPVQAMLTSGLVGAGLGYGAGALAEQAMPDSWERGKLRRTLGMVGAGLGAAPGLVWGMANRSIGRDFTDPALLNTQPDATPGFAADDLAKVHLDPSYKAACDAYAGRTKLAYDTMGGDYDHNAYGGDGPMAINVDALGRTLWEGGAKPETAGMTMGAMAAAAQMPGGSGDPGFVTPLQVANLAAHMGAGYLSGAVVGSTLGLLTGMPAQAQNRLKRTGMYLGIVRSVVPMLFGNGD
jgi:hypothetical protein